MYSLNDIEAEVLDSDLLQQLSSWGIDELTDIQKKSIDLGVTRGTNLVVSAPTSSGKTLVAEMALYSQLRTGRKVLYLVSHKALADQKFDDFNSRYGELSKNPIATVGLSTGDRDEGEVSPQLLVATYEKALGLLVAEQIDPRNSLVIADELQILGEEGRGPNIESLCAILRHKGVGQLVALSATVQNPEDLAGWLGCEIAKSTVRDIDLIQEIWYAEAIYRIKFGSSDGVEVRESSLPNSLFDIISFLLKKDMGPILVFTETRREAARYAEDFSRGRETTATGLQVSEQLELFSEPTEYTNQLKSNVERKVAFHSADLTPQTRQVVEKGFMKSEFDVCFATSTLSAGVNFPFKTVIFPKLTYQWTNRAGTLVSLGDYRNMSGRAGRLGLHDVGYSILLPRNQVELSYANKLVSPENQSLESKMSGVSGGFNWSTQHILNST